MGKMRPILLKLGWPEARPVFQQSLDKRWGKTFIEAVKQDPSIVTVTDFSLSLSFLISLIITILVMDNRYPQEGIV